MKTLLVILALVIGTTMGMNAQAQDQAKAKPQTTTQVQTQPQSQSKTMIKNSELPKSIQDNLATQFKVWTPMQAYKLDSKGVLSYEVLVKKEANEMRLFYDKDGKFIKEEPVTTMKPEVKKAPEHKPANKPK